MEQRIFEQCVDAKILDDPHRYCERRLVKHLNLTLWNDRFKTKVCTEGGNAMKKKCENYKNEDIDL